MNMNEAIEIIQHAFGHLIYDETEEEFEIEPLLYFPSISIAVFEAKSEIEEKAIEKMLVSAKKKNPTLNTTPIFINTEQANFNVGDVIQDILLEGRFEPGV